jgi:hypothetical protein
LVVQGGHTVPSTLDGKFQRRWQTEEDETCDDPNVAGCEDPEGGGGGSQQGGGGGGTGGGGEEAVGVRCVVRWSFYMDTGEIIDYHLLYCYTY